MLDNKTKEEIEETLHNLNRNLLLLRSEKKAAKRAEIIDFILYNKEGVLEQLSRLLKIKINE